MDCINALMSDHNLNLTYGVLGTVLLGVGFLGMYLDYRSSSKLTKLLKGMSDSITNVEKKVNKTDNIFRDMQKEMIELRNEDDRDARDIVNRAIAYLNDHNRDKAIEVLEDWNERFPDNTVE